MVIKILLLVVFFAVMVAVGFACRKKNDNVNGFVLGGRNVGAWMTAFAYGTSYFSAVIFIGYAGQFGWKFGIASTWIGIGNAILGSFIAWLVLGRRTRIMTQHLKSATMPQFIGARYGSKSLRFGAALIIFVFMIPYTASLYNGLSRLFEMAFNINYTWCILAMAALTCIYVVAGGYMATVVNDFIQGIIMLFGIVAVVIAVLNINGGFTQSLIELASVKGDSSVPGVYASFFGPDKTSLLAVIILTSLGTWGLPQMTQKFYAIKNEQAITKGTIVSTVFAIIVAGGCYFLGGFGRIFLTDSEVANQGFDSIIPTMLEKLPDILIAVVIVLVLSASMSTLSSLVMTSSSTMTLDVVKPAKKNMGQKTQVFVIRIFIVVFVAISAGIAIYQYNSANTYIAQMMGISWGAMAGSFLAPYIYGLYWKKVSVCAVWVNFIFAVGVMVANMLARSSFPALLQSPVNCGAFVMLAGLIIVPVVSLITKKPSEKLVDDAFSCYDITISVHAKDSLGD
ncbi:MAG: sodium:solute symporter [Clostridia bacterium]|nr:sodium:solute symporter [Clostridia bacterium]